MKHDFAVCSKDYIKVVTKVASGYGAQGRGFDPWPGHTKDFQNGT